VQAKGYRAAGCPLSPDADDDTVRAYRDAAATADIVIAEVGAWSNPLSCDAAERRAAIEKCQQGLDLADRIGARCCVNIAGSRGPQWDGPDPRDLTEETFEMTVQSVRDIVDAVKPTATHYTIEMMPWMYPDSADSYLRLLEAVDRTQVAVHLDPVNIVNSPERFFRNADLIRECFAKLGPRIVSCHAKDTSLGTRLTVHLDEVRPGMGELDYGVFLNELNRLDPDIPLMLEHLPNEAEYDLAAQHIRSVAVENGVAL
jgi:sugar phosphate isomerase/epimerase